MSKAQQKERRDARRNKKTNRNIFVKNSFKG